MPSQHDAVGDPHLRPAIGQVLFFVFLFLVGDRDGVVARDCTGVECPPLENCIKEALEPGACCAHCLRHGCHCKGYQYYDCLRHRYPGGRVPAGRGYLVDSGSTDCRCPPGGGNIVCHFLTCPDLPQNCIEEAVSLGRCPVCARVGCNSDGKIYSDGESFTVDSCTVCLCSNSGDIVCMPSANCPALNKGSLNTTALYAQPGAAVSQTANKIHRPQKTNNHLIYRPQSSKQPLPTHRPQRTEQAPPHRPVKSFPHAAPQPEKEESEYHLTPIEPLPHHPGQGPLQDAPEYHEVAPGSHKVTEVHHTLPDTMLTQPRLPGLHPALHLYKAMGKLHSTQLDFYQAGPSYPSPGSESQDYEWYLPPTQDPRKYHHPRLNSLENKHLPQYNQDQHFPLFVSQDHYPLTKGSQDHHPPPLISQDHHPPSQGSEDHNSPLLIAQDHHRLFQGSQDQHPPPLTSQDHQPLPQGSSMHHSPALISQDGHTLPQGCHNKHLSPQLSQDSHCPHQDSQAHLTPTISSQDDSQPLQNPSPKHKGTLSSFQQSQHLFSWPSEPRDPPQGPLPPSLYSQGRLPLPEVSQDHRFPAEDTSPVLREAFTASPDVHRLFLLSLDLHASTQEHQPRDSHNTGVQPAPAHQWTSTPQEAEKFKDLLDTCCAAGRRWIQQGKRCSDIQPPSEEMSPCWSVRVQCCRSLQQEGECQAGAATALRAGTCLPGAEVRGGESMRQHCCECCSLGLMALSVGLTCDRTPELGMTCSQVFTDCCKVHPPTDSRRDPRTPPRTPQQMSPKDVDECATLGKPCASGYRCSTSTGSFTCQREVLHCGRGYHASQDGTHCEDIDECQTGRHRCQDAQTCHNAPGGYRCDCPKGYQLNQLLARCVDIDECQVHAGRICSQLCQNTAGSYHCGCTPGYQLSLDNRSCEDLNECESTPCHQECTNSDGSYHCHCSQGFTLSTQDPTTCHDVDECSLGGESLCSYHCKNTPGSFHCSCPPLGFILTPNGRNCQDVDECTLGTHNCSASESCFNIQGGFRCLLFPCPANYHRTEDTRCERFTCAKYQECHSEPQRISYYRLTFPNNIQAPANIFRISPSPILAGDTAVLAIPKGNEEGYFSTRRANSHTGYVFLQVIPRKPKDFLLDVEMTLMRQGIGTKFLARLYVFITGPNL